MEGMQSFFGPDFVQKIPDGLFETEYLRIKGPCIHNGKFVLVFRTDVEEKQPVLEIKKLVADGEVEKYLVDCFSVSPSEFEWYLLTRVFLTGLVSTILEQLSLIVTSEAVGLVNFPGAKPFALIGQVCLYILESKIPQILEDPYWMCLEKYFFKGEDTYWLLL